MDSFFFIVVFPQLGAGCVPELRLVGRPGVLFEAKYVGNYARDRRLVTIGTLQESGVGQNRLVTSLITSHAPA